MLDCFSHVDKRREPVELRGEPREVDLHLEKKLGTFRSYMTRGGWKKSSGGKTAERVFLAKRGGVF